MIYSGIGARDTPDEILGRMISVGRFMASWGHTLRSGGADGADSAFEEGCDSAKGKKEIYLPKQGFRGHQSLLFDVSKEARILASKFHPNWPNVGWMGRQLMGRNSYQLLGLDLKTPTHFIVCWTPNGKVVGGTGQALRMAEHYKIPVFNLGSMSLEEINEGIQNITG